LKSFGVDRISINPQTLNDTVLKAVGRGHTVEQFFDAFDIAKDVGFRVINTDLIAGLPCEMDEGFEKGLREIIALAPENITVHSLTKKRASSAGKGYTGLFDQSGDVEKMIDSAYEQTKISGYSPYYIYRQKRTLGAMENVGFCKEGTASLYNIIMMEETGTIISIGAGAVTKIFSPLTGRLERICNPKYPYEYNDLIDKILDRKGSIIP
jgi:oxygen-independent coproporphyrinogen-3 oxidase